MAWLESDYYLAFHYCFGIGPQRLQLIKKYFGKLETAWNAGETVWQSLSLPQNVISEFLQHRQIFNFEQTKINLEKLGIAYICQIDESYPYLLTQISDYPIGLFIKGTILPADNRALAVVGTRKVTPYGREVTEKLVSNLSNLGFTIISGLARGVDGIAHRTAMEQGGRTIAILGSGLDLIYPPEHQQLAQAIIKYGALISEYPPGTKPNPGNFPARNRIISGMALGVVVTEAGSKSGSKITASVALEQNREVFAVPGPITSPMSEGPGELIQIGAKLVLNTKDILSELNLEGLEMSEQGSSNGHQTIKNMPEFSDRQQQQIWEYLITGTQHIDTIARSINLPIMQVTTALTMMELKGLVKHLGDGNYMAV